MLTYQEKVLTCERVALSKIAGEVGTPAYVYSTAEITSRARAFKESAGEDSLICYAVKANGSPALLRLLRDEGLGADVTSGGELYLALHAGIDPQRILFSGVGKRDDEIEMALLADIGAIHVESEMELRIVAEIAAKVGRSARVSIRVNPDIKADTHPYDSTGKLSDKFGVPRETAVSMYHHAAQDPWLEPVGVAAHIGSQILAIAPYGELVAFLVELAQELAAGGIKLSTIDAGGGLGISYGKEEAPQIRDWTAALAEPVHRAGYKLILEPGRAIVGAAGTLLTAVLYTKEQGGKSFVITDAGLNDLIRPALYGASHAILQVSEPGTDARVQIVDVVGPVCESGDFLARDRPLPLLRRGDLLAVKQAGAYGFAMSSNYNGRLRPVELLVDGDSYQVIRRRQAYEHLTDGCA